MWRLYNKTPYKAEGHFLRDQEGKEVWIVAIKATFEINSNSQVILASNQLPLYSSAKYFGEVGNSSLQYEGDFSLKKNKVDIIANGTAYAPDGKAVQEMKVALQVGHMKKELQIIGDQFYKKSLFSLKKSEPKEFTTMPIVYERALGGNGFEKKNQKNLMKENPVGIGRNLIEGEKLPNIYEVSEKNSKKNLKKNSDNKPTPAGFGAIASDWMPRLAQAGTYDEAWLENRHPLLPFDFQTSYYQYAPEDQQIQQIEGGEEVKLEHLSPRGNIQFDFPQKKMVCVSKFQNQIHEHPVHLQSIIIEPDAYRLILVWHSSLLCHKQEHLLQYTRIEEVA